MSSRPAARHRPAVPATRVTRIARVTLTAFVVLALTGCATLAPDGGTGDAAALVRDRLPASMTLPAADDGNAVAERVATLLTKPLDAESAVQIALLNNRELRASYTDLRLADADLVQASRLPNPGFSFGRTRAGESVKIERSFTMSIVNLLTLPLASRIESRHRDAAAIRVAGDVLRTALDTRKAWIDAVAARQLVHYREQVTESADASAELGRRMKAAGNWSVLDAAREQVYHAETQASLARARVAEIAAREKLTRLMGLNGSAYALPDKLPPLPKIVPDEPALTQLALERRFDLIALRRESEGLASALGLSRATGFLNVLELGYIRNSETASPRETGYEISLELPIFDWGSARVAKAEAIYMRSAEQLAHKAISVQSETRQSWAGYRHAWQAARTYRDTILPLRQTMAEEAVYRYNGMLIGVFDLLADAREQVKAVSAGLEAERDFWIADADLQAAIGGPLPQTTRTE